MQYMKFKKLGLNEFNDFEQKNSQGTFYQSIGQKKHFDHGSRKTDLIGIKSENGKILLASLITSIHSRTGIVFEIMMGPLIEDKASNKLEILNFFLIKIKKYLKDRHAYYLRIKPNLKIRKITNSGKEKKFEAKKYIETFKKQGFYYKDIQKQRGMSTITIHFEYLKDLTKFKNKQELFNSFSKKNQYSIKKTREFGISVRSIKYNELPTFKKYTQKTANRLGFSDKTLKYYQSVYKAFGNNIKFMVAEIDLNRYVKHFYDEINKLNKKIQKDQQLDKNRIKKKRSNQIRELKSQVKQHQKRIKQAKNLSKKYGKNINLSGGMFFIQPQEIAYVFSYTNIEFKNFYGPFKIQEEMMNQALERNIPTYNFYGISGDISRKDGVFEFKKGFNGYISENIGSFILPVKKLRYKILQSIKKII